MKILTNSLNLQNLFIFTVLILLSFLTIPHIGEEGMYTIAVDEMLYHKHYKSATIIGYEYVRPAFYNWLIILVKKCLTLSNTLIAARLVNIFATFFTSISIFYISKKLINNSNYNLLAACIFLSGDTLLKRGWLAYSDPIFSFAIFLAITATWYALERNKIYYMLVASVALSCAFLTKVATCYVFYILSLAVFFITDHNRKLLLNWQSILINLATLLFPLFWNYYINPKLFNITSTNNAELKAQILLTLQSSNLISYILKIFSFPIDLLFLKFAPISIIAIYGLIKYKKYNIFINNKNVRIFALLTILNLLPYWLVPQNISIRYIQPLYPFIAIILSYIIYNLSNKFLIITKKLLLANLFIALIFSCIWYQYDMRIKRGNAKLIAQEILAITQEKPLYVFDATSGYLRIIAEVNALRGNNVAPLKKPPKDYNDSFVIVSSNNFNDNLGKPIKTFNLGSSKFYLTYS